MHEKIIILDFGSPTTQLIGRRVRELGAYCEVVPYNEFPFGDKMVKGVILSGSPLSVCDDNGFKTDLTEICKQYPVLGIGYGARLLAASSQGVKIEKSDSSESRQASLTTISTADELFRGFPPHSFVWMSHGDRISVIPSNMRTVASTDDAELAAFAFGDNPTWGLQFHPEAPHTENGSIIFDNFLTICKIEKNWTPASFIEATVAELRQQLGDDKIILALSGGVDSSVVAMLLTKAIGNNLTCIFVDHGLLRKNEFETVLANYAHLGLNVIGVDAKERFYTALKDVSDPEQKRKIIGKEFIDIFEEEAHKLENIKWLAQGTIYPDILESLSVTGKVVKSHHNVGGLPEKMNLKLCEPLKLLFKDEVRRIGLELGMDPQQIHRHPFPGPGLGVRILGAITPEKVAVVQEADDIFISNLREAGLYDQVWQAGAILLPVQSVGVMHEERTYESAVVLRAVMSVDAMTADWAYLPHDFLAHVSDEIINNVQGVNRVVYDISSKPPATIEWE